MRLKQDSESAVAKKMLLRVSNYSLCWDPDRAMAGALQCSLVAEHIGREAFAKLKALTPCRRR